MADASKPQVVTTSERLTDTLVESNQQGVTDVRSQNTTRAVNAYGITVIKGSSVLGATFFESIQSAYTNAFSYQPIVVLFATFTLLYYGSKIIDSKGSDPVDLMFSAVKASNSTSPFFGPVKLIALAVVYTLHYSKTVIALFAACFMGFVAKPSTRNFTLASLMFVFFFFSKASALDILVGSHLFFLITELRDPKHKAILTVVLVILCFIEHKALSEILSKIS